MARVAKLKTARGVRRLIQNQPDPEFMLKPGFLEALRLVAEVQPFLRRLHFSSSSGQHARR